MYALIMNIVEVLEQALDQENDLDENDWYFLHYQHQVLILKNTYKKHLKRYIHGRHLPCIKMTKFYFGLS